ncbi:hypothetical protein D3C78_1382830 [compost metagenome]
MRHDQPLTVGIEKYSLHGAVGPVLIKADAGRFVRTGIGRHAHQPLDEIGGLGGNLQRVPTQAIGRDVAQRATRQLPFELGEGRVIGRRPDAIHPGTPRLTAGHGERRAGEQLGIETVRGFLRRVLADGQCARQCLAGKFVAQA